MPPRLARRRTTAIASFAACLACCRWGNAWTCPNPNSFHCRLGAREKPSSRQVVIGAISMLRPSVPSVPSVPSEAGVGVRSCDEGRGSRLMSGDAAKGRVGRNFRTFLVCLPTRASATSRLRGSTDRRSGRAEHTVPAQTGTSLSLRV
ncbi:unnamed protein product [Pylaiella littoralis]